MTDGKTTRYLEIELGADICKKIKKIYFDNDPWSAVVADAIAVKFTELKKRAKNFYMGKDLTDILRELTKFKDEDIQELFYMAEIPKEIG